MVPILPILSVSENLQYVKTNGSFVEVSVFFQCLSATIVVLMWDQRKVSFVTRDTLVLDLLRVSYSPSTSATHQVKTHPQYKSQRVI